LLWSERVFFPTQLGRHFWPEWSYVWGIRVDYLSPVLYFLDLLWLGWFGLRIWNGKRIETRFTFNLFLFLLFVMINVLMAQNRILSVYKWFRVGQLVLTLISFRLEREKIEKYLIKIIPIWVIFESLLGLVQVLIGASVNGWLYYMGERRFAYTTLGVAQISVMGQGMIRAYGTFSHPNSLAGFLLVVLIFWFSKRKAVNRIFWWVVTWFSVMGIVVSGSRMVWLMTLLVVLFITYRQSRNRKKVLGLGLTMIGVFLVLAAIISVNYRSSDFLGGWDKESLNKRISLNMSAIRMIWEKPLFGVGLGNFLVKLPEIQRNDSYFWLQPVHNIGLLAMSEVGLLGLIWVFLGLSGLRRGKINLNQKLIWTAILLTGMFDHYWLTLPQNTWLLLIMTALL